MTTALLQVKALAVDYGGRTALSQVDFTIAPGETLAVVGESGCGKSTLALALAGLLPTRGCTVGGRVLFDGQDIGDLAEARRRAFRGRALAMIFQDPAASLNPVWTIGEQLRETLRLDRRLSRSAADARALELLDLVAIADPRRAAASHPHQLSGGMRQRAMIALAIAREPRLLIADEPTTALDVTIQAQILALLDRLRRELSMAVLLITHDLGIVADWADRVAVMYAGRIVEEAAAAAFFERPLHPYSRRLLAATPSLDGPLPGRLPEIAGSVGSASEARGCRFGPRCTERVAACELRDPVLRPLAEGRAIACPVAHAAEMRDVAAFA